jgi:UDP-N-acetylglucosamine 1-carboxyvinyltransferase
MYSFKVTSGAPLAGEVQVSGSKNAVLPVMAAALLSDGVSEISNVPDLKDVRTMADVMRVIGARIHFENGVMQIDSSRADHYEAPYELVKTMRASIYVLGPLTARYGRARVSLPGGCAWGPRPVDLHIKGMEALGAHVEVTHGYIEATCTRLQGAEIHFPVSSVGATANILMAATLAEGETLLDNAAVEPEITALCTYLQSMGAIIEGKGSRTLRITGQASLRPGRGATIPDRIEAGTFLTAAAITRGDVKVCNVDPSHLKAVIRVFKEMGASITSGSDWIRLDARANNLKPANIETLPYPGFPTDMQAQFMAVLATVPGLSVIRETIYLDRFKHLSELDRLGANIKLKDNTATITGVARLSAAPVMASDLRASAALVIAGLVADGVTDISRIYHIDRGYENFEQKLVALGAKVERINNVYPE